MAIDYTLTRQNRKSIGIYIKDGKVEIRAPQRMPRQEIDRFAQCKAEWITQALARDQARQEQRNAFALHYGDLLPYRGGEYPIAPRPGNRAGFDGREFYMPPELPPEEIQRLCVQMYRQLARQVLREKVLAFAGKMGNTPRDIKVNGAKSRWGSCSAQGRLNFSWRLLMADDEVIDYVVVHELAHLREMNHSARFWGIVAGVLPDYKERQQRLKELQRRLSVESWEG